MPRQLLRPVTRMTNGKYNCLVPSVKKEIIVTLSPDQDMLLFCEKGAHRKKAFRLPISEAFSYAIRKQYGMQK